MGVWWVGALVIGFAGGVLVGRTIRIIGEDLAWNRSLAEMERRAEESPVAHGADPAPAPGRPKKRPREWSDCLGCLGCPAREYADQLDGLTEVEKLTHTRWPRKRRR